jgi:hypothetical protein
MSKVHEKCKGCEKIKIIDDKEVCTAYRNPSYWWETMGGCPLATHTHKKVGQEQGKVRLTIQKKKKTRK